MPGDSGYDRMLSGQPYGMPDFSLIEMQSAAQEKLALINALPLSAMEERMKGLAALLGAVGDRSVVIPPIRYEFGTHIRLGSHVLVNFECMFMDGTWIDIGDYTLIAPRVQFITATHATRHEERTMFDPHSGLPVGGYTVNRPIKVGSRCWIGAGATILPGVTIGDDTVIGAASVVTKSIPAGVIAAGNPCRIIRDNI